MNILITGANGNVGGALSKLLEKNHKVFTLSKAELDVTNKALAYEIVMSVKPDIVIHAAAITNIDLCEKNESLAYAVNTIGTLNVAYPCSILDVPIVYLSTNYVYDGSKCSPFYETDDCTPINVYGKTKLAGERLIRTLCSKYFIIRTSWIFGGGDCFIKKILVNENVPIFLCPDETSNLTYIKDLYEAIEKLIASENYGVYNCANQEPVSKSRWLKFMFDDLHLKRNIVELPESYIPNRASRPKYSALSTTLIRNSFQLELPCWKKSLSEYLSL